MTSRRKFMKLALLGAAATLINVPVTAIAAEPETNLNHLARLHRELVAINDRIIPPFTDAILQMPRISLEMLGDPNLSPEEVERHVNRYNMLDRSVHQDNFIDSHWQLASPEDQAEYNAKFEELLAFTNTHFTPSPEDIANGDMLHLEFYEISKKEVELEDFHPSVAAVALLHTSFSKHNIKVRFKEADAQFHVFADNFQSIILGA